METQNACFTNSFSCTRLNILEKRRKAPAKNWRQFYRKLLIEEVPELMTPRSGSGKYARTAPYPLEKNNDT